MEFSRVTQEFVATEIRPEPNSRALAACVVVILLPVGGLPFGCVQYYP